jgi:quercetin dioxygenase-like cupin family protein
VIVTDKEKVEEVDVGTAYCKGKPVDVTGVGIRWLSKAGQDEAGNPQYGLRLFSVEPGAEIPTHDHQYSQTIYVMSGKFECWTSDPETGLHTDTKICGPGDVIYVPGLEPHGMRNLGTEEAGTFLCCICSVQGEESL